MYKYVNKGARLESVWLFVWSQSTPYTACYILSDEFSIPFYSTSNGYNYAYILVFLSFLVLTFISLENYLCVYLTLNCVS